MLKDDEICPGLTFAQHAESLAMFDLHTSNAGDYNDLLSLMTEAWLEDITYDLAMLQPYEKE